MNNVRFLQADFSAPTFKPAHADVYFTYWSNGERSVMTGLFDRLLEQEIGFCDATKTGEI